jgi:hypothetical protein
MFANHKAKVQVKGPYLANGVPPEITLRDPTPAEEAAEKAKGTAHFDTKEALLRDHYQEFYALILRACPLDRCWK